jgi:hypothetical protein
MTEGAADARVSSRRRRRGVNRDKCLGKIVPGAVTGGGWILRNGRNEIPALQILTATEVIDNRRHQVPFGFTESLKRSATEQADSGQSKLDL